MDTPRSDSPTPLEVSVSNLRLPHWKNVTSSG